MSERAAWLRHPLLDELGVEHGFGLRTSPPRRDVVRPLQVHGVEVARLDSQGAATPREADAIVSVTSLSSVGVVTADCVPLLVATGEGEAVAAIHAGWRGLAAGVVAAGIGALAARFPGTRLVAAIGPHIGACCYEVDEPVVSALAARFGDAATHSALRPTRPGHGMLELAVLVERDLERTGVTVHGRVPGACTRCDSDRFHSYRRDGARAGRLLHFISPR